MRKAGTLHFKQMAEGDISDACKTVKAANEKNADRVFHKSYNARHQGDLVMQQISFKPMKESTALQVNIQYLLAQSCGVREDQHIQKAT